MIDKKIKIVLTLTFILSIITYSFWELIKVKTGVRIFYPCTALMFVGYTYTIKLLCQKIYLQSNRFLLFLSYIVYLTTLNNLVDEILFNPLAIEINEYIGFASIIVIAYYNYYVKWEK